MGKGSGSGKGAILADGNAMPTMASRARQMVKHRPRPITPPKGLRNVGNTCYANAALQCLMSTALTHALMHPESVVIFRRYSSNPNLLEVGCTGSVVGDLSEDDDLSSQQRIERKRREIQRQRVYETSTWLTRELTDMTRKYTSSTAVSETSSMFGGFLGSSDLSVVNPGSITKHPDRLSPCLRPYQQEDAHEFFRALLSTLTRNGHNRQLSSLFDGLLESAVTCQECGNVSLTRDRYMDLSLDVSNQFVHTLNDALAEFTQTEILDGDNRVVCSICQEKQAVSKGLRLATAPSVLVCHLKRFAYDRYGRLVRLSKKVRFPLRLEIGDYMSRVNKATPPPYELVAVLVHEGRSCDSGHYLAYVKSGNEWYKANDSVITKVDVSVVLQQQAYILIYEVAGMRGHGYGHESQSQAKSRSASKMPRAPRFRGSVAPEKVDDLQSTFLKLLCTASEVNDAILRDFCCGAGTQIDTKEAPKPVMPRRPRPRRKPLRASSASPQRRAPRYTFRDDATASDDTVGNFSVSTLGESSLDTRSGDSRSTDSDTLATGKLRKCTSSGNLRDLEEAYRHNPQRQRSLIKIQEQRRHSKKSHQRSQSARVPRLLREPLADACPPKPATTRRTREK